MNINSIIAFFVFLLCISVVLLSSCQKVPKPTKNGEGPLALKVMEGIPAPQYHKPIKRWVATHMDKLAVGGVVLKNGEVKKISIEGCMGCHSDPDNFCNHCHDYVGVKRVEAKTQ